MRTLRRLCAAGLVVALTLTATATAADFRTLYDDYSVDGQIDGCDYDSSELAAGLGEIPADVRAYDPGFSEALNGALEQRASGCESSSQTAEPISGSTAEDGSPGPTIPRVSSPQVAEADGLPGVLLAVIAVLGAGLAVLALVAAANRYGWELGTRGNGGGRSRLSDRLLAVRDRLGF